MVDGGRCRQLLLYSLQSCEIEFLQFLWVSLVVLREPMLARMRDQVQNNKATDQICAMSRNEEAGKADAKTSEGRRADRSGKE